MESQRLGDYIVCNPTVKLKKGQQCQLTDIDSITIGQKYPISKGLVIYDGQSGSKFSKGDTIMARITPCLENGKIAMYNGEEDSIGSTELFVFRGKEGVSTNEFVYYFFKQDWIRNYAANSMTGASGRQRADIKFIQKAKVQFPPLATQQKVASILSAYDSQIENNQKRIKLLEQMAENLYKEWFVRFRFPGYETAEFEGGVPKGWKLERLEDFGIVLETGSRPKGGIDSSVEAGVPSLGAEAINGLAEFDYNSLKLVPQDYYDKMKRGKSKGNHILVYKDGAYIGKVTIFRNCFPFKEYSINEHVFFLNTKDSDYQNYLYFTLNQKAFFSLMQNLNRNAAQPGLSQQDMNGIKVFKPTKDVVNTFNHYVEPIFNEVFSLAKEIRLLTHQRDLLLPRLMSGKLSI